MLRLVIIIIVCFTRSASVFQLHFIAPRCEARKKLRTHENNGPNLTMAELMSFGDLLCNFTARYFNETMASQLNRSVLISPLAVMMSYVPFALFSEGETHQEIYDVFGLNKKLMDTVIPKVINMLNMSGKTENHSKETLQDFNNEDLTKVTGLPKVNKTGPYVAKHAEVLEMISSIYVHKKYHVTERFNDTVLNLTGVRPEVIDFAEPEEAETVVDAEMANRTHNLIKHLINSENFANNASIIAINSIYFRGFWFMPFPDHRSKQGVFYSSTGPTTVTYMKDYENENYEYFDDYDLDSQILIKRYVTNLEYGCMFLLPNARDGLKVLIADLVKENQLTKLLQQPIPFSYVNVTLPKFAIEVTWNVTGILTKMGIRHMYSEHANFHDVLQRADGDMADQKVRFSGSYQAVRFDLNETGSDAAVTMRHFYVARQFLTEHNSFVADHPFVFVVFRKYLPLQIGVYEGDDSRPDPSRRKTWE